MADIEDAAERVAAALRDQITEDNECPVCREIPPSDPTLFLPTGQEIANLGYPKGCQY